MSRISIADKERTESLARNLDFNEAEIITKETWPVIVKVRYSDDLNDQYDEVCEKFGPQGVLTLRYKEMYMIDRESRWAIWADLRGKDEYEYRFKSERDAMLFRMMF